MKLSIEIIEGRGDYGPSFNLGLASKEGADAFLVIKGCRMIDGQKGRFVSMPAKKLDSGKYFNHVWSSEAFQDAVKAAYDAAVPKPAAKPAKQEAPKLADMDDDIPF